MRISDWSSDVCSSDLIDLRVCKRADILEHVPEQVAQSRIRRSLVFGYGLERRIVGQGFWWRDRVSPCHCRRYRPTTAPGRNRRQPPRTRQSHDYYGRTEERRAGKEWVRRGRARGW